MWYGLTREEAASRCRDLGVPCRFLETRDPKALTDSGIARVIRAREEKGGITFLIGYFAEEKNKPGL
ncbi:hypothetical protein SDC9_190939 [bioreactor metagenome]|uniref:Uncharacterized protein n=1 Tax=bioreactor metagenome TaxID=1076179 RepID=A0A645HWY7_9ZZZZ